jgi:hypothetical protein
VLLKLRVPIVVGTDAPHRQVAEAPTLDVLDQLGLLPEGTRVHLDAGYDSGLTRTLLAERGLTGRIARKGLGGWRLPDRACEATAGVSLTVCARSEVLGCLRSMTVTVCLSAVHIGLRRRCSTGSGRGVSSGPSKSGIDPVEHHFKTDVELVAVVVARPEDVFDRQLEQVREVCLWELVHDRAGHRG